MLKKSKYKRQSEIGGTDLDKFFVECTLASYTNFDLKSHKEKAERIADKYKLSYIDGIEKLYEKGLKAHKIVSDRLIKEFTKIEENEYTISKRYATLYGTEKRISMLTEIKKEIENESDSLAMSAEAYLHSTQKKEIDWAVGAGIADGLAGTGAAVLTAIDIQAKNAEIRAQNKENLKMAMPIYTSIIQNSYERIAYVTEKIKSAKQKQLSDKSSAEVFNMLEFTDSKITISDTGAFLVNTTVQVKKKLDNIFGDLPATIDGTIIAHIYENSTEVAKVNMILPIDGVFNKANISGVAPSNALPEKSYTIKFSAGNLWLMEK